MRIFCSTTIFFFLALVVFGVSSFVVPAPCRSRAAAQHAQTTASSAVRRRQHHLDHVHTRPNEATTGRLVLAAAPRGGGGDGGDELEEKAGIEPKYLAAIVVFLLAAAYDLFVTHEGRLWEL